MLPPPRGRPVDSPIRRQGETSIANEEDITYLDGPTFEIVQAVRRRLNCLVIKDTDILSQVRWIA